MPTFKIKGIFRITDRGHVLSGHFIEQGIPLTGDKALLSVDHETITMRLIGISREKQDGYFGLLISFDDYEKLKHCDLKEKELKIVNIKERQKLGARPIEWTGDLSDDCTAKWAGLMLRAEWMDENYWWWSVYDMLNDEVTIDSSNNYSDRFVEGQLARQKAEEIAKAYLDI